jgi:hypothetical protein
MRVITTDDDFIELSGAQVAALVGLPSAKLATYVSNPERWLPFFPGQRQTGPGRSRYYSLLDAVVVAMLVDTSDPLTQAMATEVRQLLAAEIREVVDQRPDHVSATIDRLTVVYRPRWELLDTTMEMAFGGAA